MATRKGSDTGNLDYPSTTEAHHNKEGMFVMNDPEAANLPDDGMVQTESGIFVPAPKDFKHFRIIQTKENLRIEVEASPDEIKEAVFAAKAVDAPDWFAFKDPTFGLTTWLTRETLASCVAIAEDFKDLDLIKQNQDDYFKSKTMDALRRATPQTPPDDQQRILAAARKNGQGRRY